MNEVLTVNQIRYINKVISGLDASLARAYVHADILKKYFDGEFTGVFTVTINDESRTTKLIFTGPEPDNTVLAFNPANYSYKYCIEFIKYIAEQTGTNVVVLLDGTCIPVISLEDTI